MSDSTVIPNPMPFERLEDFTSYTSCIKSFGKSIIPPLVTTERRDEICGIRASAIKKETEILRRESYFHPSKKAKEIFHMVAEHLASSNTSTDFMPDGRDAQDNGSALRSFSMNVLISSPSTDLRSFESSMHMSMTKIPSSDICSTVHTGVIVCPNICNNQYGNTRSLKDKSVSYPVPPNEFCFHMANPECSLCQTEHSGGPFPLGVPYIESPAERICSVSDEEQGSVAEETDFESLVTVVPGRKANAQDTDNESNFTCLTQSTDLEKYMDCSIEYSSPDDGASLNKSQMSNQLNVSSRSDDASSETLVNTESELTPCASALSELNEDKSGNSEAKKEVSSSVALASSDVQQRAHSVDSYMKIIKTCARNLLMRKSQSEPSHSDVSNLSNNFLPLTSSCEEGNGRPVDLKLEVFADTFRMSKDPVHLQAGDTELASDNIGDPSTETKKLFGKRHIRSNSYTLDEPSSALIMAHSDCNCKDDSETVMSPHSCASEKMIAPSPNPAFKKEKINIVLPPTPDRDKYFPILNSTCYREFNNEIETPSSDATEPVYTEDSSTLNANNIVDKNNKEEMTSESKVTESESLKDGTSSQSTTKDADGVNLEQVEISLEEDASTTGIETTRPNEQNIVMSSASQSQFKGDDLQIYLNEIILEIKEKQQTRVQKLLKEQNKQWLQLQEEFREQEKLLCAKLNSVGMSSSSDNFLENKPPSVSGDKNKWNAVGSMPSDFQICPDMKSLCNLNIRNVDHKGLTTTKNYSNSSEMSLSKLSCNEVSNKVKDPVNDNLSSSSIQHSNISVDSTTSDKNITTNLNPSCAADNVNLSVNFPADSLERSQTVHSSISSRPVSNFDYHKSQSSINATSRCSSVQSENLAMSIPCSQSPFKMNDSYPDVIQTVSYRPSSSFSSSFTSNASEGIQNSYFNRHRSLSTEPDYDADCHLKDKASSTFNKWFVENYPSVALPNSSSSAAYMCANSERQLSADKNNQASFYTTPDSLQEQNTDGIIPPTYQPSLHSDNIPLNGMENYSQNSSVCHNVSSRENFEESVFTSLGNCTLMALPITNNSEAFRHFETNLSCNHEDTFKDATRNFETSNFGGAIHFNPTESYEIKTDASVQQKWQHEQNNIAKNKVSDGNHSTQNSTFLDSDIQCHSNMPRKVFSKNALSIPLKSQSDSSINQNAHKIPVNAVPNTQAKVQKQIISSSLTNLKRKQSKEFIRDPNLLKKFEKLPAFVKGYLTRRLFKTERVQGLIKTLQDTALLIGKLGEELTLKGDAVSEHDVDFHRQLIVQLMTTFHNVYDIFCTISVQERMKIISESRSLEQKKKAAEKSKDSLSPVIAEKTASAPSPPRKSKLSAATLKALERKRKSTIDNRTYTVEDLKGCRARIYSATSCKSHSSSPSRIYKSPIGLALKRKTTNGRKIQHWK